MADSNKISRATPKYTDMDYAALREKGLEKIQKNAAETWTDHNLHDPGITILEQLCVGITDLGYRNDYLIKDLIAQDSNHEYFDIYTPLQLLSTGPVTENDIRAIVIDHKNVRNAWISGRWDRPLIPYNGLYEIKIELGLSEDGKYDLNENVFRTCTENTEKEICFEVEYPHWDPQISHCDAAIDCTVWQDILINNRRIDVSFDGKDYHIDVEFDTGDQAIVGFEWKDPMPGDFPTDEVSMQEMFDVIRDMTILYGERVCYVRNTLIPELKAKLQTNRAVCEDFIIVSGVKIEKIRVDTSLEVAESAEVEEVLAEVYYAIRTHISKVLQYYTLEDRLNGKDENTAADPEATHNPDIDDVINGPAPTRGFIIQDELPEWKENLFTSDLVKEIMAVPDVNQIVDDIELQNYLGNYAVPKVQIEGAGDDWGLVLSHLLNYIPRFDHGRSTVNICKRGVAQAIDEDLLEEYYVTLINAGLPDEIGEEHLDLSLPSGTNREVDTYSSVINDFPQNYGIGPAGLPPHVSEQRKAQAKQLKGFLMVFDQLMTNHLEQLANINQIFSLDRTIDRTYFHQTLHEVLKVADLYVDCDEDCDDPGSNASIIEAINDKLHDILEPFEAETSEEEERKLFLDRRNGFLDHLLARFAEKVADKDSFGYKLLGVKPKVQWINDKVRILQNYKAISNERHIGFDYTQLPVWDTDNVSGLKKRVCMFSGIHDYTRKSLCTYDESVFEIKATDDEVNIDVPIYQLVYQSETTYGNIFSVEFVETEADLIEMQQRFNDRADIPSRYQSRKTGDKYWFWLNSSPNAWRMKSDLFGKEEYTPAENEAFRDQFIAELQAAGASNSLTMDKMSIKERKEKKDVIGYYYEMIMPGGEKVLTGLPLYSEEAAQEQQKILLETIRERDDKSSCYVRYSHNKTYGFYVVKDNGDQLAESVTYTNDNDRENAIAWLSSFADGENFHVVEHILLRAPDTVIPSDHYKNGGRPYECQLTYIIPKWPKRFASETYQQFLSANIRNETPAHLYPEICWVEDDEFSRDMLCKFEAAYQAWLTEYQALGPGEWPERDKSCDAVDTGTAWGIYEGVWYEMITCLYELKNIPFAKLKLHWEEIKEKNYLSEETGEVLNLEEIQNDLEKLFMLLNDYLETKVHWNFNNLYLLNCETDILEELFYLETSVKAGAQAPYALEVFNCTIEHEDWQSWENESLWIDFFTGNDDYDGEGPGFDIELEYGAAGGSDCVLDEDKGVLPNLQGNEMFMHLLGYDNDLSTGAEFNWWLRPVDLFVRIAEDQGAGKQFSAYNMIFNRNLELLVQDRDASDFEQGLVEAFARTSELIKQFKIRFDKYQRPSAKRSGLLNDVYPTE